MKRGAALLVMIAALASPASAGYEEGIMAYDAGNYSAAYDEFSVLSAGGHAGSDFMLGAMYFYGKGKSRATTCSRRRGSTNPRAKAMSPPNSRTARSTFVAGACRAIWSRRTCG